MAHYAFLDDNNVVVEVIVGVEEDTDGVNWEQRYGEFRNKVCKRTSYNTFGNVHKTGGIPFRKNYAGIGYTYDETLDAFVPPKPFNSWNLNQISCLWEPPASYPEDGNIYSWKEETLSWVPVTT